MSSITIEAVAITRESKENGLRLEWIIEGGISALESPGIVLFASAEGNDMCDDDGSREVQIVSEFDEQKERELFEASATFPEGVWWSQEFKTYRSINMRAVEASDALDATIRLQGWLACAKSRSGQ